MNIKLPRVKLFISETKSKVPKVKGCLPRTSVQDWVRTEDWIFRVEIACTACSQAATWDGLKVLTVCSKWSVSDVLPIKAHGLFVPQRAPTRKRCHRDGLWMIEWPIEWNIGSGGIHESTPTRCSILSAAVCFKGMFQSLQIACDYRSRQFDSPARWADLCPHRAEAKLIFLPFKVPSTPNQGCLAYVVFASAQSQRVNRRCLYGCITESEMAGANWLCIIAGSTTSDDRIFPGQGTQLSATSPLPCPLSDLCRSL